jgi:hypothetical protein
MCMRMYLLDKNAFICIYFEYLFKHCQLFAAKVQKSCESKGCKQTLMSVLVHVCLGANAMKHTCHRFAKPTPWDVAIDLVALCLASDQRSGRASTCSCF